MVLEINGLTIKHKDRTIVSEVKFSINKGEWLAVVGESGSGKTLTGLAVGNLLPRGLITHSGEIIFQEVNLRELPERQLKKIRGKDISYIFQDYQGAFTPFITIGKQFDEMLKTHTSLSKKARKELSLVALNEVNLPSNRVYSLYPFQLSGGQLQRAAIAMAMVLKPKLLIADEPTTALDSITAAKILKLIFQLKEKTNCAVLFITHDLRHVRKYADKMAVMLKGKIVEADNKDTIFQQPQHKYTNRLFAAIPPMRGTPERLL
jgi:peptide/nickel transport system ATP-binding protein